MFHLIKSATKSLLLRAGYEIWSVRETPTDDVDILAAKTVKESKYYTQWTGPCPLFSPWLGHPDFQEIYEGATKFTLVSPDRCYILINLARYAAHLAGDFAECGVWKGGTALMLARVLGHDPAKKLYLFDSFRGLPPVNQEKDPWFSEGQYSAKSVDGVKELLRDFEDLIDIREGWIPKTFRGLEEAHYAFVHIDVDIY